MKIESIGARTGRIDKFRGTIECKEEKGERGKKVGEEEKRKKRRKRKKKRKKKKKLQIK